MRGSVIRRWGLAVIVVTCLSHATIVRAAVANHAVIAEVQIGGASAKDEFVELYNPTTVAISLEGWRLSRRTASGSESNLLTTFPALTIAPHASVLIAHPEGAFAAQADVVYSTTQSLAANNSLVLYGPEVDGARSVIDLVGWGTATSIERAAAPELPANQSLERKPSGAAGNGNDTDTNAADFALSATPTPQSSAATARPPITAPAASTTTSATTSTPAASGATPQGTTTATPSVSPSTTTTTTASSTSATTTTTTTASATPATTTTTTSVSTPSTTTTTTTTATTNATSVSTSLPTTDPSPITRALPPPTHVRINEFVADPAEGEEWIELVNVGPNPLNLADWWIEDGSEAKTILAQPIGTIGASRFVVIEKPKGNLNNAGDRIVLKNSAGVIVDAVSYGNWNDGRLDDNAPAASDPASVARVIDGEDSNIDRIDFVRTETPTRGAPNVVSTVPSERTTGATGSAASVRGPLVVLNELLPNPRGDDRTEEYIELANLGSVGIDLTGWRLADALGAEYTIRTVGNPVYLHADQFLALSRAQTGIALDNTGGETVRLFKSDSERAVAVAEYRDPAPEGASWARQDDGRWAWTEAPTRGAVNVIVRPNRSPQAVIGAEDEAPLGSIVVFDGSDSADPDGETLAYFWDFGDARTEADVSTMPIAQYVYDVSGTYEVRLRVEDPRGGVATTAHRMTITTVDARAGRRGDAPSPTPESPRAGVPPIRLSEVIPNPEGADAEGEWIELEHAGVAPLELEGWTVVIDGSSPREVTLTTAQVAPASGFLVLDRASFRYALRNDHGAVTLRAPDGQVVDVVTYDRAVEGQSYARVGASWVWTTTPTRGTANAITVAAAGVGSPGRSASVRRTAFTTVASLAELDDLERGDAVVVRGTVIAAPGSVGKQIFYLADAQGGVQVYVGNRAIPKLVLGDTVEVTGELREAGGEPRVGIRTPEDVRVVATNRSPPTPATFRIQDASDRRLGELIHFEGEVVEQRGQTLFIDDGSDEIRVSRYQPPDGTLVIREGDMVRIAGVLSKTTSGFRVLVRNPEDLVVLARATVDPATLPEPSPLAASTELALLGGGGSVLMASSLWRRRKLLALASRGVIAGVKRIIMRA